MRLALLATNTYEYLDNGQWYRYTPAMLGDPGDIEVHAFGRRKGAARDSTVKEVLNRRFDIKTRWTKVPLSDASAKQPFDLAMSFSGLTGGPALLNELVTLAQMGTPLYLTSFSSTHALLTHAVLRAHGAEAEAVVARNPFGLVSKRVGENWNRVISKVSVDALPRPDAQIDAEYLDALQVPAAMVLQSHLLGDPSQTWPVGGVVEQTVVHTMDGVAIDLSTRDVINLNEQCVLGKLSDHFNDVVVDYDESWDETSKLFWASHIRFFAMQEGMTIDSHTGGAAA